MSRLFVPALVRAGIAFALACCSAHASVLTLSPQGENRGVVRDAANGAAALGGIAAANDRLLVEAGALAADAGHDLVYAAVQADPAGSTPAAPSLLVAGAYGAWLAPAGNVAAPVGMRFQALAFDAPSASLVGIVAGVDGAQAFTVATNGGAAFGSPTFVPLAGGCCRFLSGVSAWRAATRELFVVGWRDGDGEPQLLRLAFGAGGATVSMSAYPIVDDSIAVLAVDAQDASLHALARSALDFTYLAQVTYAAEGAPVTLSAMGSAPASCCYASLGQSVIDGDGSARAFYVLARDAQLPVDMQLVRLPLNSGDAQIVNASISGFGLWADAAVLLDRIFADGFD